MGELQQRMGAGEFAEWAVFLSIEPIGALRDDLHTAMLMTLLANANRDRKKKPKPFALTEFLPDFWKAPEADKAKGAENLLAKFKMLTG